MIVLSSFRSVSLNNVKWSGLSPGLDFTEDCSIMSLLSYNHAIVTVQNQSSACIRFELMSHLF